LKNYYYDVIFWRYY